MATKENRLTRVVATAVAIALIGSGVAKLVGEPNSAAHFMAWGLPRWFLLLVGTFEVAGGVLLVTPATRPIGSLVLGTIMVGAMWTHASQAEWGALVPPTLLLSVLMAIFRATRARAIHLLGGASAGQATGWTPEAASDRRPTASERAVTL